MKTISSTTLARHLGDCLAKVKYRGEEFLITRNDEVIAELRPFTPPVSAKWGDLAEILSDYPADPDFADDLERVNRLDSPPENPWS